MISVLQIAFYSLATIWDPNPPFQGLMSMHYVSGYYCSLNPSATIATIYSNLGLSSYFLNNFNVMICSIFLCPLLGIIFNILSRYTKTIRMNKKLYGYFKESINELLLSVCIFNCMSATISLILNLQFMPTGITGIVIGFLVLAIVAG